MSCESDNVQSVWILCIYLLKTHKIWYIFYLFIVRSTVVSNKNFPHKKFGSRNTTVFFYEMVCYYKYASKFHDFYEFQKNWGISFKFFSKSIKSNLILRNLELFRYYYRLSVLCFSWCMGSDVGKIY